MANDPDGKTKTISTEAGLRRLGRQLQRTEQELWSDLALRALRVGKVDKALKILRLDVVLCMNAGETIETLIRLIKTKENTSPV